MVAIDYLALKLVQLEPPSEWAHQQHGLSLLFPDQGQGIYRSGAFAQNLSAGDVLVANRTQPATVRSATSDAFSFRFLCLAVEHLYPLFAHDELSWLQKVAADLRTVRLYPASTSLALECHQMIRNVPPTCDLKQRSHLLCIAAAILSEELKLARTSQGPSVRIEDRMVQVFERLSTPDLLTLPAKELANRFGCSRRHLNRLFHRYFGFSLTGMRAELRLLKAATLLRDPSAKVDSIAQQSGFNHLGLFSTSFRRRFGNSPGKWRKQTSLQETGRTAATGAIAPVTPMAKSFEALAAGAHPQRSDRSGAPGLLVRVQAKPDLAPVGTPSAQSEIR